MDRDHYINLTMAVYRVTELFPENDPLKIKIREKANDLLADLILFCSNNSAWNKTLDIIAIEKHIDVINAFFDLAQEQDLVDPRNFLVLKEEYIKIRNNLLLVGITSQSLSALTGRTGAEQGFVEKKEMEIGLNERQKKILKVLEKKDRIQVWEIKEILPNVTKRTLRRDFEYLLNQGLIKRIGERNETFYQLVGQPKYR